MLLNKLSEVIARTNHINQKVILNEYEIIKRAVRDPENFRTLYDRYYAIIFQFIFRRIGDEDTTADLVSQTFYLALKNIKNYEFRGLPFSAWLYRIATHEVIKYHQQARRTITYHLETEFIRQLAANNIEEKRADDMEYMKSLLKSLNKTEFEILELRFLEQRSFEEISYILSVSVASAKMRTYRALGKLKNLVKKERNHDKI
jgi:RNA polymerase sigma-70 factor (ECF subfamily)